MEIENLSPQSLLSFNSLYGDKGKNENLHHLKIENSLLVNSVESCYVKCISAHIILLIHLLPKDKPYQLQIEADADQKLFESCTFGCGPYSTGRQLKHVIMKTQTTNTTNISGSHTGAFIAEL